MVEFTEHFEGRLTDKPYAKPIKVTKEQTLMVEQWNKFISANRQMVNLIVSQKTMEDAKEIAIDWYVEVMRLGKLFYGIDKTTRQIQNNLAILLNNLETGNLAQLERTYITTFTNVAKYQIKE